MTTFGAFVSVDRAAAAPLHRQVYDGLRRAILDGVLRPGERVPSTRALAAELEVSRFPVLSAYDQLLHEGYLEGRVGSGTYVSASLPDDAVAAAPVPAPKAQTRHRGAPAPARDWGGLRPFRVSVPPLDRFPRELWAGLVARHARALPPEQMAYGDPAGVAALRTAVAGHLRTARAVRCEADQVIVVPGSQAALRITAAALLRAGDRVAIEEPGYPGAHAALAAAGARMVPVGVDGEGIDVAALERLRGRVRAVYVTPAHQYPLGASMSAGRRLALLDWARRRDAWILEDDYDSEYRYVSRPLGALQGMDQHARVIYVGTFSKVLFPALRIGYLVVPPALLETFIAARLALDLFSPSLYQLALAELIESGHFARHLRRMRAACLARRNALVAGLAAHCRSLSVHNADAGLHLATLLPDGHDDAELVRRMAARGLTATALSSCYLGPARRRGLLLGFGGFAEERIAEAARILGELC
jgi:GntR family transcriptional regulator/MocR family aminotransferase